MGDEIKKVLGIAPTLRARAKESQLLHHARQVHPEVRKFIANKAVRSQVVKKQKSYYSTVRFPFDVQPSGGAPQGSQYQYSLKKKQVIAFSYGISEDMTSAGFPTSYPATEAETNLISRGDTGGAVVEIYGISLHLDETSDAALAKMIWSNVFADITLDGTTRYALLGRLGRITSSGGLYGAGQSYISTPPLHETSAQIGVMTNGMPHAHNFYKLHEKIRWNPSSMIDSKFQLRFETKRDIVTTAVARAESVNAAAFTPPDAAGKPGTYVDVVVYLHTHEIMPRTLQP
jgi:hypothetical protein